jgi:carboxyl-terminal processing protease
MQETPRTTNRLLSALGILALVAIIFTAGFFIGGKSSPEAVAARKSAMNSTDLKQFWNVWSLLQEKYPFKDKVPNSQEKVYGAIQGLVASYEDPYTMFFPPVQAKQFNEEVSGSFGGVGMEVGMRDGLVIVIAPLKDSPSEKAGIKTGDIVTKIDDTSIMDLPLDEVIGMIRGPKGTTVSVTVARSGEAVERVIPIVRDTIAIPTIATKLIDKDTFVVELYSFSEQSPALMEKAITEFTATKRKNLILDLRGKPGGYLDAAVEIGSAFKPEGKIIIRENFGSVKQEVLYRSHGYNTIPAGTKTVILIDGGSASASEILAGAMQEHGVAKLVGTKSFGKGSVQELMSLSDGSSIKITIAEWLTPNGVSISKAGLKPDVVMPDDEKTKTVDETITAALKVLRQ